MVSNIFTADYIKWAYSSNKETQMDAFSTQLQAEDVYDEEDNWCEQGVCVVCGEDSPYEEWICNLCQIKFDEPYCVECNQPLIDSPTGEVCLCPPGD